MDRDGGGWIEIKEAGLGWRRWIGM